MGNSEGEGGLKGQNFKRTVSALTGISRGESSSNLKTLCEGSMDILWKNTLSTVIRGN